MCLEAVRYVLAIAAQLCFNILLMDVKTTLLNTDLDETEYIWLSAGVL